MLNNNNLIKIGLLTALIAFGVIGVFAIGRMSVSSLVYGQQQSRRQFSLIHDTFSLGFRQYNSVRFNIDPAAENVVLSGQYRVNGVRSPIIGVYVVDASQCVPGMDLSLCPAVYLHSKQLAASGSINLDPGKHYYLIFSNDDSIIQAGTEVTSAVVAAQFAVSYNFPIG